LKGEEVSCSARMISHPQIALYSQTEFHIEGGKLGEEASTG